MLKEPGPAVRVLACFQKVKKVWNQHSDLSVKDCPRAPFQFYLVGPLAIFALFVMPVTDRTLINLYRVSPRSYTSPLLPVLACA